MPQIPLFVSSAKAGSTSNGSFSVNFQPPLELPETAKNATIEVQQMSVPYTTPNISAARENNTVVIQIPNKTRDDFVYRPGSTTEHAGSAAGNTCHEKQAAADAAGAGKGPAARGAAESAERTLGAQRRRSDTSMGGRARTSF